MKFIIFTCFVALAYAKPLDSDEFVEILRDDRVHPEDGKYSFDIETENGIVRSESGSRLDSLETEPVGQQGSYSFTFPNGEQFDLKFVANENGFQPESSWLPVAPEFPHPIPQFVLDQIAKAAIEDAEAARNVKSNPSAARSQAYYYQDDSDEK